jgi:hypothetical protein
MWKVRAHGLNVVLVKIEAEHPMPWNRPPFQQAGLFSVIQWQVWDPISRA